MSLGREMRSASGELDPRTVVALLYCAVAMVLLQFLGSAGHWAETEFLRSRNATREELQFEAQCAWALTTTALLGVLPFLIAVLGLRMRPSEFGFRLRGLLRHLWIYGAMLLVMAPAVWWASQRPDFRATYPFPILARVDEQRFWIWEGFYFLQFCAVEMFFRGFMVFLTERRLGLHGILVMTIPYAMIHLHKPLPEALGAVGAGLILGFMALKTRSFYGGILLHYAVALAMDLLATRT